MRFFNRFVKIPLFTALIAVLSVLYSLVTPVERRFSSQRGAADITAILGAVVVLFVGMLFIVNLTPEIETQITSANITNTMTKSLVDMSEWAIPVGGIGALIFGAILLLRGQTSRG